MMKSDMYVLEVRDLYFLRAYLEGLALILNFHCYNPLKPSKWYIKLFEVLNARTGYAIGFDVYTGKNKTECALNANILESGSTQTTKVVLWFIAKMNFIR